MNTREEKQSFIETPEAGGEPVTEMGRGSHIESTYSDKVKVYMKIIEYKRSIGKTQWTVFSIFATASEAVFVLSLKGDRLSGLLVRIFGIMIYWFGLLLYDRYRGLNKEVCGYLIELENEIGFGFQQRLTKFRQTGLSTKDILIIAGILYTFFAIVISFVLGV